jgi:hypothetical protein
LVATVEEETLFLKSYSFVMRKEASAEQSNKERF